MELLREGIIHHERNSCGIICSSSWSWCQYDLNLNLVLTSWGWFIRIKERSRLTPAFWRKTFLMFFFEKDICQEKKLRWETVFLSVLYFSSFSFYFKLDQQFLLFINFPKMAKGKLSSDIIKHFHSDGDVVTWLKKLKLVARLHKIEDIASLYIWREIHSNWMRIGRQTSTWLKPVWRRVFLDGVFSTYAELKLVRWEGDVSTNKIWQLAEMTGFTGCGFDTAVKLAFVMGFFNAISMELQQVPTIKTLTMGDTVAGMQLPWS